MASQNTSAGAPKASLGPQAAQVHQQAPGVQQAAQGDQQVPNPPQAAQGHQQIPHAHHTAQNASNVPHAAQSVSNAPQAAQYAPQALQSAPQSTQAVGQAVPGIGVPGLIQMGVQIHYQPPPHGLTPYMIQYNQHMIQVASQIVAQPGSPTFNMSLFLDPNDDPRLQDSSFSPNSTATAPPTFSSNNIAADSGNGPRVEKNAAKGQGHRKASEKEGTKADKINHSSNKSTAIPTADDANQSSIGGPISAASSDNIDLGRFPLEIRNMIYGVMFTSSEPISLDSPQPLLHEIRNAPALNPNVKNTRRQAATNVIAKRLEDRKRISSFMGLLRANKRTSTEARLILYGQNKFTSTTNGEAVKVLQKLSGRSKGDMRRFVFRFPDEDDAGEVLNNILKHGIRFCIRLETLEFNVTLTRLQYDLVLTDAELEFVEEVLVARRVHLPAWEAENGARGMVAMEMIGWVPQRAKVVFKGEAYYLQKYVKAADEHNKKIPA